VYINTPATINVPSGGRSVPINITVDSAPYSDISIAIYQVGTTPTYSGIYPLRLTFTNGLAWGVFWASIGKQSKGSSGRLIYLLSGTNNQSYVFVNRVSTYYVTKPDSTAPIVLNNGLIEQRENSFAFFVWVYQSATIYYYLTEQHAIAAGYSDIRSKIYPYEYYGGKYQMGEYIDANTTNNYTINITGLDFNTNYTAYVFVESLSGNLASSALTYSVNLNSRFF
jgi:hypothetical protein